MNTTIILILRRFHNMEFRLLGLLLHDDRRPFTEPLQNEANLIGSSCLAFLLRSLDDGRPRSDVPAGWRRDRLRLWIRTALQERTQPSPASHSPRALQMVKRSHSHRAELEDRHQVVLYGTRRMSFAPSPPSRRRIVEKRVVRRAFNDGLLTSRAFKRLLGRA